MYCISCGAAIPEGAAFCPACGTRVPGNTAPEKNRTGAAQMRPAVCVSCGGNRLQRIARGEYRCEHCGTRFFWEGEASPAEESADARAAALIAEADEYHRKEDTKEEVRALGEALKISPDNSTALIKLGRAYNRMDLPKEARECYERAREIDPSDPTIYNNIGVLYHNAGQYAEARSWYRKGIDMMEADPLSAAAGDKGMAYGNYAFATGLLGNREEAEDYLRIARKIGYPEQSLAVVCDRLGFDLKDF